jgi:uncharacterized protein YfdQ (DUF2303 family)
MTNTGSNYVVSSSKTEAEAIADTAQLAAEPSELDPAQLYTHLVPEGANVEVLDLEQYLDKPRRKRGEPLFWDAPSMAAYVNKHKDDRTTLYMNDVNGYRVIAVLDGHSGAEPGWVNHRATLEMRKTDAWARWLASNEKLVGQEEFAEHIERNLIDIQKPAGADLLELAQTFQATTKVEFRDSKQLASGQRQFQYVEETEARGGGRGELTIPKEFELGVAPFEGCDPYRVVARLRYRLRDGKLSLGYVLDNPRDVERHAFRDVAEALSSACGLEALYGRP